MDVRIRSAIWTGSVRLSDRSSAIDSDDGSNGTSGWSEKWPSKISIQWIMT